MKTFNVNPQDVWDALQSGYVLSNDWFAWDTEEWVEMMKATHALENMEEEFNNYFATVGMLILAEMGEL